MHSVRLLVAVFAAAVSMTNLSYAAEIEVVHWWTSPADAAAIAKIDEALGASGHNWVDTQLQGAADQAKTVQRILGGDPPGAAQLLPGRDASDLIQAGHLLDLTDLANQQGWSQSLLSPALAPCLVDGHVYCVPVSLRSTPWLWINLSAFQKAGAEIPTNWAQLGDATDKLKSSGVLPLAVANGWPVEMLLDGVQASVGGPELWDRIYKQRDADAARGQEMRAVFEAMDDARQMTDPNMAAAQWNDAVNQVVRGDAAATVMGDWALGEFLSAGKQPGVDFECLPALGAAAMGSVPDVLYFPKSRDPEVEKAQLALASLLVQPDMQAQFNTARGAQPVRDDFDMAAAGYCMRKAAGKTDCPKDKTWFDIDSLGRLESLQLQFFSDTNLSVDEMQSQFADIVASADITSADKPKCCPKVGNCPESS